MAVRERLTDLFLYQCNKNKKMGEHLLKCAIKSADI